MARTPEFSSLAHDIPQEFAQEYKKAPQELIDPGRNQWAFLTAFGGYQPAWYISDKETGRPGLITEGDKNEFIMTAARIMNNPSRRNTLSIDDAIPILREWVDSFKVYSVNVAIGEDRTEELLDVLPGVEAPVEDVLQNVLQETIEAVIRGLSPERARILRARYGIGGEKPRILAELAEEQGVSKTTIRYREKSALESLRRNPNIAGLRAYIRED